MIVIIGLNVTTNSQIRRMKANQNQNDGIKMTSANRATLLLKVFSHFLFCMYKPDYFSIRRRNGDLDDKFSFYQLLNCPVQEKTHPHTHTLYEILHPLLFVIFLFFPSISNVSHPKTLFFPNKRPWLREAARHPKIWR